MANLMTFNGEKKITIKLLLEIILIYISLQITKPMENGECTGGVAECLMDIGVQYRRANTL